MVDIIEISSKAFILGISTGSFCTTTCLPLLIPALFSREQKKFGSISTSLLRFLTGRFIAYLLFGVITGFAGIYLNEFDFFQTILIPAIYLLIGFLMIFYGIVGIFKHYNTCRSINRKYQNPNYLFILGFLMGVNICPPFILALGVATDFASIIKSLLFFIVFFFATSIFFLPLIFSGFVAKIQIINKIARYASIIAGLYFIYVAIHTFLVLLGIVELIY